MTELGPTKPFLTFCPDAEGDDESPGEAIPIYFQEDWHTGIGGGLWSTGLAFSQYLTTKHALVNMQQLSSSINVNTGKEGMSVLELGSGNGLLSICLMALAHAHFLQTNTTLIQDLAITDLADHLPLVQKTLNANPHILSSKTRVHVFEHCWGEFHIPNEENENKPSFEEQVQQGNIKFDLIVGSDVAYHEDLYDILISSLLKYSHRKTVILIGVTMNDTKPDFFHKLRRANLEYEKFSDHLLDPDFRGRTFGIFSIQRRRDSTFAS